MKKLLFILCLVLCQSSFAGIGLRAESPDANVQSFLDEVQGRLPDAIRNLNGIVKVRFAKLDSHTELRNPCEVRQMFGKARGWTITLHQNLLKVIGNSESTIDYQCGHKNFRKLAVATLVHEVVHVFDRVKGVSNSNMYKAQANTGISLPGQNKLKNTNFHRSPDAYEYENLMEHLAVNTEYFILDPEYACRRPNLARTLATIYGMSVSECPEFPSIKYFAGDKIKEVSLHPENVSEISYVLAGTGTAAMSRFGHSLFRIKFRDSSEDLGIGFVGLVDDTVLNSWKGLTGKYPSRIHVAAYSETIKTYTRKEFRSLSEYPIKFSEEQKRAFLQQLLSSYFEYSGKYFFITNNCATEALSILKIGLRDETLDDKITITPRGVLKILIDSGYVAETPAKVRESHWVTLEKIFHRLPNRGEFKTLKEYWSSKPTDRERLFETSKDQRSELLEYFALESAILAQKLIATETAISTKIVQLPETHQMKILLGALQKQSNALTFGQFHKGGYGIPSEDELELSRKNAVSTKPFMQDLSAIEAWGKSNLQELPELMEYKAVEDNLNQIKEYLRALKAAGL